MNGHNLTIGAGTVASEAYGTGNASTKTFTHTAANGTLKPGSVAITVATDGWVATDDSNGNLTGTGITSGTVNYETGAMSVTYAAAPGNTNAITVAYTYGYSAAMGAQTRAVRLTASGNCHVAFGPNPGAKQTDMLIKSTDWGTIYAITPGERISVVQDGSATGTLNITEMTH